MIALFDACMLACDQCEVLSRVLHADAQAKALVNGRKLGGPVKRWAVATCRLTVRAAVAAANLKMAAAVRWVKHDGMTAEEMMVSDRRSIWREGGHLDGIDYLSRNDRRWSERRKFGAILQLPFSNHCRTGFGRFGFCSFHICER